MRHCIQVDWPARGRWLNLHEKPDDFHAKKSWMGSLLAHGRDASGQYYRRNRYYDSSTGRFTQEDPIGLAGGINLYGFANGDPISYSDPYGLCPWWMQVSPLNCEAYDAFQAGGARGVLDLGVGMSPVLGDLHDGATALTGRNAITRERVGVGGRVASGLAAAIPFVTSRTLRNLVNDLVQGRPWAKSDRNGKHRGCHPA